MVNVILAVQDRDAQRRHEILQQRRDVLFQALKVVDNVYANSNFEGQPALPPRPWDIELARSALNGMLIYCENPEATVKAFSRAIGLHNPEVGAPVKVNAAGINGFRLQVARELEIQAPRWTDDDQAWIVSLPGTTEAMAYGPNRDRPGSEPSDE